MLNLISGITHPRNIVFMLVLLALQTPACEANDTTSLKIRGTVVLPPPCTVNNDQSVTVEFDSVRTDLIDGESYDTRTIPVVISCVGTPTGHLMLSLQGTATSFRSSSLTTSVPGLGIRIRRDSADVTLNTWFDVHAGDILTLTATPDKQPGQNIGTGEFTATATVVIKQE